MTRITPAWLSSAPTRDVMAALGGEGFFVGGCVRDAVLGREAKDIDIATPLVPEIVSERGAAAGLRVVPTGIAHGTVTLIAGGQPYEVTTFRRDVSTDGRRAIVSFSTSLEEDAARRDLTMNGLYADAAGEVTDPVGGLDDLARGYVRFIGTASRRIREDYLRSLRFFRFHAWYGDPAEGLDEEGLAAIAANLDGLPKLSAERVGAEFRRLLGAPDPSAAVAAMAQTGVLAQLLPGADAEAMAVLVHLEERRPPQWLRRLAGLGLHDWADALRLTKDEMRALEAMRHALSEAVPLAEAAYRLGGAAAADLALLRGALFGGIEPGWQEKIAAGDGKVFPVKARDLIAAYGPGPALGEALKRLEAQWIAADFRPDRTALLEIDRRARS